MSEYTIYYPIYIHRFGIYIYSNICPDWIKNLSSI